MAEFQDVIEQFKRLCDSANQDCSCCGLGNMSCSMKDIVDNSVEFEKRVMSWAAEHPVVYPTWAEYLERFGFTPGACMLPKMCYGIDCEAQRRNTWLMTTHIPADTAEKLGLKPKECRQWHLTRR